MCDSMRKGLGALRWAGRDSTMLCGSRGHKVMHDILKKQILLSAPAPLTYGGIADAYGFCFEFVSPELVAANNDLSFHQHPEFLDIRPGVYSDDTQMQIALAELIASKQDWTPEAVAQSFVDVFKRDPRKGYARRFQEFLENVESGAQFLREIKPASERNGAAMRAPVIGLIPDLQKIVSMSEIQAKVTHDTKGGVDSAIATSLMSHYFAYNLGPKDELPSFLAKHVPGYDWSPNWASPVPCHGISTVQAALTAICKSESYADLLVKCVQFSGDVDSVATIALASASGAAGFRRDLPDTLWEKFEPSDYGLAYLLDLDRRVRSITIECTRPACAARD